MFPNYLVSVVDNVDRIPKPFFRIKMKCNIIVHTNPFSKKANTTKIEQLLKNSTYYDTTNKNTTLPKA